MLQNFRPHEVVSNLRQVLDEIPFEQFSLTSFKGKPVMKRGFFPGGHGLFDGEAEPEFPYGGTLVLGSNFGRVDGFVDPAGRLIKQDETTDKTWTPLRASLNGAQIDLRKCFFTNARPCLHAGPRNTVNDLIPDWLRNADLMRHCTQFFAMTCSVVEPSLIVALGPGPAAFLASVIKSELKPWESNTIAGMDRLPINTIQLEEVEHRTVCVAIVHPCYQRLNAKLRARPYQNIEGEILLLKEAHELRKAMLCGDTSRD